MPGDVFLTLGNEGKVNKATCNLGCMVLNDIAGGTNIAFAFNAKWQGGVDRVAFEDEDLNGFVWTAPAEGVSAGTEIICRGIGGFAAEAIEGTAIQSTAANPIVLETTGVDFYSGGENRGSWVSLDGGLTEAINGDFIWVFQPSDALAVGGWDSDWQGLNFTDVRMLSCVGRDLNGAGQSSSGNNGNGNGGGSSSAKNTAVNTLLYSSDNSSVEFFNDDFTVEAQVFFSHQWRFDSSVAAPSGSDGVVFSDNIEAEIQGLLNAACLGDQNTNGMRDIIDLLFLLADLNGNNETTGLDLEAADCDCDGFVGVSDMLTLLTVFGVSCE